MRPSPSSPIAPLDRTSAVAFYRQIYDRVRAAIHNGVLRPGDRLPSTRGLMQELGLARGTVEAAYALLASEGYIVSRGQAGTVVAADLRAHMAPMPRPAPVSRALGWRVDSAHIRPFQMGLPALDAFPRVVWARLGASCLRAMQPQDMAQPPAAGQLALRAEIAAYLQMARGIDCTAAQVFVTSGYGHSMALLAQALLQPGDTVWSEDPAYPATRQLLAQLGLRNMPVPVDADGLMVGRAMELAPQARAAIVTPAHQSPLCVSLSLPRRHSLLDWAHRSQAWVIEDDYDGEYRYTSRPLPALKSLDRHGRVLYLGTFSKVLFPGIRLAYMVVPPPLVERFERLSAVFASGSPGPIQTLVAAFMREGHFGRHIQRMRKLYSERRRVATTGLTAVLGGAVQVDATPGGMHLVLRLQDGRSDAQVVSRMREAGLYAHALSDWTAAPQGPQALLLGFTNVDGAQTAHRWGQELLRCL